MPVSANLGVELAHGVHVAGDRVVLGESPYHAAQPFPGFRQGFVDSSDELPFNFLQLSAKPFTDRLSDDPELSIAGFPATMREA